MFFVNRSARWSSARNYSSSYTGWKPSHTSGARRFLANNRASGFTDGLGPYNAVDSLIAGVTSGSSLGFIDAGITILVWGYITYILNHIGFFGVMERYINNFFKTMHDGILDFLVAKVDEKVLEIPAFLRRQAN